jgi:hypothetical protein
LASGPSRSPFSTRESMVIRVLLSRTLLLTMPSRPSSPRRSTTRPTPSLFSTRLSYRVSMTFIAR